MANRKANWWKEKVKSMGAKGKLGAGGRFKALTEEIKKGGSDNPDAVAASIGRKKYGKSKFQKLASAGLRRK